MTRTVPLQSLGKAKDIADCAIFLASPAARYITGITIGVDGGSNLTMPNFPFAS